MFTQSFTDPQGVSHTDAIFEVAHANYSENTSDNHNFDVETNSPDNTSHTNKNLQYRMYYWVNQAARDAGNLPYVLANSTTGQIGETHYVTTFDTGYEGLTTEKKAEKHCKDVVLAI